MKTFITTILIIFLLIAGYLWLSRGNGNEPLGEDQMEIETSGGSVRINNVYGNPVEVNPQKDALVKRTDDYDIVYLAKGESFLITLSRQPLEEARQKAENDFLGTLGISKDEACELNVSLKVPGNVDINLAGEDYGLSFCTHGRPF